MFTISTQCYEDYGTRIKAKGGRNIVVECELLEDAHAVAKLIRDDMEHIVAITPECPGNLAEEDAVLAEMEAYSPVRYVRDVVRKGKNGDYFLKRGYIVNADEQRPEFKHLAGKFVGWVDNLNTNTCVLKIEGDKRTPLNEAL